MSESTKSMWGNCAKCDDGKVFWVADFPMTLDEASTVMMTCTCPVCGAGSDEIRITKGPNALYIEGE